MAFDLLLLDGVDLRRTGCEARRSGLAELLGQNDPTQPIHFSEHIIGGGPAFFAAVEAMCLEGIVSRKRTSRYRSGPSRFWFKTKAMEESELV